MKRVTIFYHRVDYDGLFSAYIANSWYSEQGYSVTLLGFNYGDAIPDVNMLKIFADEVVILDVTFPPETMKQLISELGPERLVWIDHHATSIKDSELHGYSGLTGKRLISYKGACELTWEWYYPETPTPKLIQYLSAHDTWDKGRFLWNDVLSVQSGLRTDHGMSIENLINCGNTLFNPSYLEEHILPLGRGITKFQTGKWKTQVRNAAFEIMVAGKLRGLALLSPDFSSAAFESVLDKGYQVFCICNVKNDCPGYFSVSLYSEPDGRLGSFELGLYMKENYQGGGHKCAAGGKLNAEQFKRLIFERQL